MPLPRRSLCPCIAIRPAWIELIRSLSSATFQVDLGDFITRLRQDLVDTCVARSHVSHSSAAPVKHRCTEIAADQIRTGLAPVLILRTRHAAIGVFEQTSVIFCEIGIGREELFELHKAMNTGGLTSTNLSISTRT